MLREDGRDQAPITGRLCAPTDSGIPDSRSYLYRSCGSIAVFGGFARGRPAVVGEWNDQLGGASRGRRSSARACVNRIPDRDGSTVAIRRPPTIEYRQGRDGVDREPGDHLRVFVSIDVLLTCPHE